jgi:hypothetical protein
MYDDAMLGRVRSTVGPDMAQTQGSGDMEFSSLVWDDCRKILQRGPEVHGDRIKRKRLSRL